jgi:hypothetical protein
VSVAIKKLPGVEAADVSLNQGLVSIKLARGNTVRIDQIRKAILNDAFKPRDARVRVVGELFPQNGKLEFKVSDTGETFPVLPADGVSLPKEAGRALLVDGLITAPAKGTAGGALRIMSYSQQPLPVK